MEMISVNIGLWSAGTFIASSSIKPISTSQPVLANNKTLTGSDLKRIA